MSQNNIYNCIVEEDDDLYYGVCVQISPLSDKQRIAYVRLAESLESNIVISIVENQL